MGQNQKFIMKPLIKSSEYLLKSKINESEYLFEKIENEEIIFIENSNSEIKKYSCLIKPFEIINSWFIYPFISLNNKIYKIELNKKINTCNLKEIEQQIIDKNKKDIYLPFGHILIINEEGKIERISHEAVKINELNLTVNEKNYFSFPLIYEKNKISALQNLIIIHEINSPHFDFLELSINSNELIYKHLDLEDIYKIQVPMTEDYETAKINEIEVINYNTINIKCKDAEDTIWYFEEDELINKKFLEEKTELEKSGEDLNFSSIEEESIEHKLDESHSLLANLKISTNNLSTPSFITPIPVSIISSNDNELKESSNTNKPEKIIEKLKNMLLSQNVEFKETDFIENYENIKKEFKKISETTNFIEGIEIKRITERIKYQKPDIEFIKNLMYKKILKCNSFKKEKDLIKDFDKLSIKTSNYTKILERNIEKEVDFIDNQILEYLKESYLMEKILNKSKCKKYKANELFCSFKLSNDLLNTNDYYKNIEASSISYCSKLNLNRNVEYNFSKKNEVIKNTPSVSVDIMQSNSTPKADYIHNNTSKLITTTPSLNNTSQLFNNTIPSLNNTTTTFKTTPSLNNTPQSLPTDTLFKTTQSLNTPSTFNTVPTFNTTFPSLNTSFQLNKNLNTGFQTKSVNLSNIFNKPNQQPSGIFSKTNKQDELLKKLEKDLHNN